MPLQQEFDLRAQMSAVAVSVLAIFGFYLSSQYSYLLFHNLVEIVTASVGFALFALTWNARRFLTNGYLRTLGVGYGLIAVIDLVHTMAYKGMNIFPGYDANLPTQLWIAARYIQAGTLCAAPFLARRRVDEHLLLAVFSAVAVGVIALIFAGRFPDCFIEGQGLTGFKIDSEYLISAVLAGSLVPLHTVRREFNRNVYRLIVVSTVLTVLSEISFTAYASVYGFANMLGHLLKLGAFYLIYRALLVTGFADPFDLIFRDLKETQDRLRRAHDTLEDKVEERTAQLRRMNRELSAVGNCHKALLRANEEQALLDNVCRIVCEDAGYRMTWIGYVEHDAAKTVRPVAWSGAEKGYLSVAGITWAEDADRGRGAAGKAIRSGRSCCIQDFALDTEAAPWREAALERGYGSCVAMPLKDAEGRVFGVMCIYSTQANAFTGDEMRLLDELSADLAFGIVVIRARHDLSRAEEQVRELNRDLERRVEERTAQLAAANKELEAFSYSISHDLRAPLRAIDGFSQILREEFDDRLTEEGRRYLGTIRSNAQHMGNLIDDLLAFARTSRHEMVFDTIDMTALAHEVFDEVEAAAPGRKIVLRMDGLPPARGDSALIRQVFVNLLSNAVKFTAKCDEATIDVSGSVEDGSVVYCVKDNGAGFDMTYANKLFGVFQRLHRADEFEGTGIGLAIVKRVIVKHGGRIWADGKVGSGASFFFTLPRA